MSKRLDLYIALGLILLTAALYWPVIQHEFLNYDDHLYVTDNPVVQEGLTLQGVYWAFRSFHASNWHPITWLSHMVDANLFFLSPAGHHLTNLLFHLVNTVLLFQFLKRVSGARWPSALVAALFAWHPMHVESVAWVAERKDVLSTCFLLLSLFAYVRYVQSPGAIRYLLALALFAFGLMSKPMLVTTPFLLLLLDSWPLRRIASLSARHATQFPAITAPLEERRQVSLAKLLREKLPFVVLSAASCILTVVAQHKGGALKSLEAMPLLARFENAIVSYAGYLWKMVWPVNLAVFYPMPANVPALQIITSVALLATLTLLAWLGRGQRPYLAFGWLWYLGSLVPVIGLVQVGGQSMADRYTYIPSIGFFVMAGFFLAGCLSPSLANGSALGREAFSQSVPTPGWQSNAALSGTGRKPIPVALASLALLGCLAATHAYLPCWENSRSLFAHAIRSTSGNYLAHNNLGVALKAEGKVAEAVAQYFEAVRINPNFANAHFNLALNLVDQERVNEALFHFSEAARLGLDSPERRNGFGITLAQKGHLKEALGQFLEAIRQEPSYAKAHYNLAMALAKLGRISEAIVSYRKALRLQPEWPEALQSLAWLLATHENNLWRSGAEAVALAEQACKLTGDHDPEYLDTLAAAYAEVNRLEEAVKTAQKALELARLSRQSELASRIEGRLRLYQAGRPFREKA